MKGLMILFLAFFTILSTCYSLVAREQPQNIVNQLSCLLDYPAVLGENGGIVVIEFSVGEGNTIGVN
tara:strand:+ start:584 stop:784 length:201 start_codon:yes stop_codon:yes gene_type:complete